MPHNDSHRHNHSHDHAFEGRHSRFYDVVASRLLRPVYRRLARDASTLAAQGAGVLDVGTGPGALLAELAKLRPDLHLTGVDLSADMVAAARRRLAPYGPRAEAVQGDVAHLPFPDASFDLIVSSLSLHHWAEPKAAVAELTRVLRPNGVICVYDLPRAPFNELGAGSRSELRTGIPFVPPLIRLVLATR